MKSRFNLFVAVVVALIASSFFPSVVRPAQVDVMAIAVGVGFDRSGDDFKMTVQILTTSQEPTNKETLKVISVSSPSVLQAVNKLSLVMGKQVGLAHTTLVAIGKSAAESGIEQIVEYLIRTDLMGNNAVLVSTEDAQELLTVSAKLESNANFSLHNIVFFNEKNLYLNNTNLETFQKGLISPIEAGIMSFVGIGSTDVDGLDVKSSKEDEESSEPEMIVNSGMSTLFKKGVMVANLTAEETHGMFWLNPSSKQGSILLENVGGEFEGGNCILNVRNKNVSSKTRFENGVPIFENTISVIVEFSETNEASRNSNGFIDAIGNHVTKEVEEKIIMKINEEIQDFASTLKKFETDVIGVFEKFAKSQYRETMKSIEESGGTYEFFNKIEFRNKIEVFSTN